MLGAQALRTKQRNEQQKSQNRKSKIECGRKSLAQNGHSMSEGNIRRSKSTSGIPPGNLANIAARAAAASGEPFGGGNLRKKMSQPARLASNDVTGLANTSSSDNNSPRHASREDSGSEQGTPKRTTSKKLLSFLPTTKKYSN